MQYLCSTKTTAMNRLAAMSLIFIGLLLFDSMEWTEASFCNMVCRGKIRCLSRCRDKMARRSFKRGLEDYMNYFTPDDSQWAILVWKMYWLNKLINLNNSLNWNKTKCNSCRSENCMHQNDQPVSCGNPKICRPFKFESFYEQYWPSDCE